MNTNTSLQSLFSLTITAFIFVTIFDPADVILHLKIPLFILCLLIGYLVALGRPGGISIPIPLIIYTLLFVAIPLLSIFGYFVKNGSGPYEGFAMLKAYLFIFFAIILVATNTDITRYLSAVLSLMAFCIISLFVFLRLFPDFFVLTNALGAATQIFYVDIRSYGGASEFQQAYFVCSPMLVVPISYYFFRFRESCHKDLLSLFLLIVNLVALLMAGSRNNMFAAIFMLPSLYIIFRRRKVLPIVLMSLLLIAFTLLNAGEIASFLDPSEVGNSIKLSYLPDYAEIFVNLNNLFFGQGLGAYHKFAILSNPYFVTELTYLEVFRNFGLISGTIMMLMLVYPIFKTLGFNKTDLLQKYMAVAYSFYLVMCFTNPNLFSSMGILILCVLLSGLYRVKNKAIYSVRRDRLRNARPL